MSNILQSNGAVYSSFRYCTETVVISESTELTGKITRMAASALLARSSFLTQILKSSVQGQPYLLLLPS